MSKKTITTSLVTPTYNWPEALELLLLSLKAQIVLPDEVIIADDGSNEETRNLIRKFQENFPVPLHHVWHEDRGNRKPAIMNKAIASSKHDYIIEIDGDIIMHKHFVGDHIKYAQKGFYLFGSRVNIQKNILQEVITHKKISFHLLSKGLKKRMRMLHIPTYMLFSKPHDSISKKLRGCNMSFWKTDFIKVNGFNEELVGWGIDDSEMIQRLHNIGILGKRLKHNGIAFHLYHKEQNKSHIEINQKIEQETKEKRVTFIDKGINQYL